MTVSVDPAQLDGYAAQLERNSEWFVSPLRAYCAAYCGRLEGMTGLLYPARMSVSLARDTTTDLLSSAERNLFQVATNLRAAATNYRAGDLVAAERIWLRLPGRAAPEGYAEVDNERHPGDFRDPFVPRPAPPSRHAEVAEHIARARQQIGIIDEMLQRHVRFSLAEQVMPWLSGDWDTLREDADGYAALAGPDGVQAIRDNLRFGMDSLSASWDSPAATQFAFQIRDRWLPAIDALQHIMQLHKETFEQVAQQAEVTFHLVVLALEALKLLVVEKTLRIVRIAATALRGGRVWDEVMELVQGVWKTVGQIGTLFELLRLTAEAAHETVQAAGAAATVIEDTWLAPHEPRLDPIRVGLAAAV